MFLLVINFFFKTVAFEFNDQWLFIDTGLIRSGSVQFVIIGFQFFSGYSTLFQFVNDVSIRFSIFSNFPFLHPTQ